MQYRTAGIAHFRRKSFRHFRQGKSSKPDLYLKCKHRYAIVSNCSQSWTQRTRKKDKQTYNTIQATILGKNCII